MRKNNRRSLAEVGTTTISYNITARSDLSQSIQDILNDAVVSGFYLDSINWYGSDEFRFIGYPSTVYGNFSTTNIQVGFPVSGPTSRPTMGPTLRPTMGPTSRPAGYQACDIIS